MRPPRSRSRSPSVSASPSPPRVNPQTDGDPTAGGHGGLSSAPAVVNTVRPFSRSSGDWNQIFDSQADAMAAIEADNANPWGSLLRTSPEPPVPIKTGDPELDALLEQLDHPVAEPLNPTSTQKQRYLQERDAATSRLRRRLGRRKSELHEERGDRRQGQRQSRHLHFRGAGLAAFDHSRLIGIHRQLLADGRDCKRDWSSTQHVITTFSQARHSPSPAAGATDEAAVGTSKVPDLPIGIRADGERLQKALLRLPTLPPQPDYCCGSDGTHGGSSRNYSFGSPLRSDSRRGGRSSTGDGTAEALPLRMQRPDVTQRLHAKGLVGLQISAECVPGRPSVLLCDLI